MMTKHWEQSVSMKSLSSLWFPRQKEKGNFPSREIDDAFCC